jgi:hypothetical protein
LLVREKASLRYGLLAVQVLIVYWFFPHDEPAAAHRNHAASRWIDQHKHEFMSGLTAGRAVEWWVSSSRSVLDEAGFSCYVSGIVQS